MPMMPPNGAAITRRGATQPVSAMERLLRTLSVVTMLMTVPQVVTIWAARDAGGVSLLS